MASGRNTEMTARSVVTLNPEEKKALAHDVRLAVVENTLAMAHRSGKLIVPGN